MAKNHRINESRDKPRWDCNFIDFINDLQTASIFARNQDARRRFVERNRKELALVVLYLHELAVTGGAYEEHLDPPEACDLCGAALTKAGFFVDGGTTSGEWANMCPTCYADHGAGFGWGIGLLYRNRTNGRWSCVAGSNPDPEMPQE
jgi:hypothetical protein